MESKKFVDSVETLAWFFCTCVFFTFYNPIGELGKARGLDYGPLFHPNEGWLYELDRAIPLIPEFVFPYVAAYALPLVWLGSLLYTRGLDMGAIRRFFLTQMALITVAFFVFYNFPVRTNLFEQYDLDVKDTWIHQLNYKFVHQGISLYVSVPSMHNAHAWSVALAFYHDKLPGTLLALVMAVVTCFSTIFTRPHHVSHVPLGVALGLLGHFGMYARLGRALAPAKSAVGPQSWARFYAALLAPAVFVAAGTHLETVSGWKTDIPAMFGFESNPIVGFYGF